MVHIDHRHDVADLPTSALVEGNSLRSPSRMTGVAINTVVKLLLDAGEACADQDRVMRNLKCQRLQCDEIW